MDESYELKPEEIISDLLVSALLRAHKEGRRHLYIWEASGLAWLAAPVRLCGNAWAAACIKRYAAGEPVLPGWDTKLYEIKMFGLSATERAADKEG